MKDNDTKILEEAYKKIKKAYDREDEKTIEAHKKQRSGKTYAQRKKQFADIKEANGDTNNIRRILQNIAKEFLNIPTLQARMSDSLDFHEVAVWQLEKALAAAYKAGHNQAGDVINER